MTGRSLASRSRLILGAFRFPIAATGIGFMIFACERKAQSPPPARLTPAAHNTFARNPGFQCAQLDAVTLVAGVALLLLIAVLSCSFPARTALRTDATIALRT